MVLLFRVKQLLLTLIQLLNCKRAIRIISHQPLFCHILPIFKSVKLLWFLDIFKLQLLTFVFESLNNVAPHVFHTYFLRNFSIHSYETCQSSCEDICVDKQNTLQFGLRYLRFMGATLWNELRLEIRNSTSLVATEEINDIKRRCLTV